MQFAAARTRMPSSTSSPPRMPVSQSWMTATLPNASALILPRCRLQRVLLHLRTLVAEKIVAQVLVARDFRQTLYAAMLFCPLLELARWGVIHAGRFSTPAFAPLPPGEGGAQRRMRGAPTRTAR